MAKKFSEPSEGASVFRVDSNSKSGGPMTSAAKDLKSGRVKKAAGEVAGGAVGAYVGGEAGAKVGSEVGSRLGDKADKKDQEKKEKKQKQVAEEKDKSTNLSDSKFDEEKQKEEEKKKKKNSPANFLKRAHQVAQLAQLTFKLAMTAKFAMVLKMMLQLVLAVAQAVVSGIVSAIVAIGQAIVTGIATFISAVGAFAAAVIGGVACAVVAGAVALTMSASRDIASRDDTQFDCADDTSYMYSASTASGNTLENAKKVYAFFKAYGLADTNIAGILGNWSHESGIDPTGVETIFTEKFIIPVEGTRKYEIWKGSCRERVGTIDGEPLWEETPVDFRLGVKNGYGIETGMVTYTGDILTRRVYTDYHADYPLIQYMGIGLGQWTNGRNRSLLRYADRFDEFEWYDLDLQLMFCVDKTYGDDVYYVDKLAGWTEEDTATDAAMHFCERWEGITYQPVRGQSAEEWLVLMSTWQEGVDYDLTAAESLIAAANASGAVAADNTGSRALRSCSGLTYSDNSSAAVAAVSFAWGPGEDYSNDGTECWLHLFNTMLPGDAYPRCCDRTVAVAVWWSGTDTEFEYAGTSAQLRYLLTSPRWEKIDWGGKKENLLPGDVLIRNDAVMDVSASGEKKVHHIIMYVGNDIVKGRFGEEYNGISTAPYEFVSGSINQYSPHVGKWSTSSGSGNYPSYYVFRNVERYSNRPEWTDLTCVS